MGKPLPLGTINACGRAQLVDSRGHVVARCLDTPNCVQVAFEDYPSAVRAVARFNKGSRKKLAGRPLSDDQRKAVRIHIWAA